jgi:hypothetical protein
MVGGVMTFRIVDRRPSYGARSAHTRFQDPLEFQRRFDKGKKIIAKMRKLKLMASIRRAKRMLARPPVSNVVELKRREAAK